MATQLKPEPEQAGGSHTESPAVNTLFSIYLGLFFLGYLFYFWQLSTRWPSS